MYTFGQLKAELRLFMWPDGEAESLVIPHNQSFIDALFDLQKYVRCLQQDNTQIVPQCATFYNCGITTLDAPRGYVKRLAVLDKINPTTGVEDATSPDDWCSLIDYVQVDPCYMRDYFGLSRRYGCCLPYYFGCAKGNPPTPTDEGLPKGLPLLQLGYHYPQDSTDGLRRASGGVWCIERGKIFLAPWIQSTETIVLWWDGIKREWNDADEVDTDPLFKKAVRLYVQAQHAAEWDREPGAAADFTAKYNQARAELMHECDKETRVRDCEASQARASQTGFALTLFYNDAQSATAHCDDGQTGDPVTVTIPAGTVASSISKADANATAKQQAQTQATAQLVCVTTPLLFWNVAKTATASCVQEAGAPRPDGDTVTRTVPAHTVSGSTQQEADDAAQLLAQQEANAARVCTFWNRPKTSTAICTGIGSNFTANVAEHTIHSTTQADADAQAQNAADTAAAAGLPGVCSGAGVYHSTVQQGFTVEVCEGSAGVVNVAWTVTAGYSTSNISQTDANQKAHTYGEQRGQVAADTYCALGQYGIHNFTFP